VLAIMVSTATLTFGASLRTLISHPRLYGWNFSYALYSVDGYGPLPASWTGPLLARDPDIQATTGVYFQTVQIDCHPALTGCQTVPALLGPVHPAVAPLPLSGHGLDGTRQIVLGPATLAQLHKRIGQTVTVTEGGIIPAVTLRIAGTATLPAVGTVLGVHATMSTGALLPVAVIPAAVLHHQFQSLSGPNAIFVRLRPGVNQAAARQRLQQITRQLDRLGRSPQAAAVLGDFVRYMNAVSLLPVQRPAEIVNYRSMGTVPEILAGGLAAGTLAALALTLTASVGRRRRDFALLKTLGFTRRQLAGAVAWQSSVIAAVGLLAGLPLGIAAGRWLWLLFAHQLSAVPEPTVPVVSIALVALAALVLSNAIAALPGRRAASTPVATVLRAE
jgi:ABC-type antimicrobial peptide transport system permease subunit